MTRYKLPDALGGGEVEAREWWSGCAGAQAEYELDGGCKIVMALGERLELVKPPLPPEPGPGLYLFEYGPNGDTFVAEDEDGYGWHVAGYEGGLTWEELQDRWPGAKFRRLIPEPEPVELPWHATDIEGNAIVVERSNYPQFGDAYIQIGTSGAWVEVAEMTRALWTAAGGAS